MVCPLSQTACTGVMAAYHAKRNWTYWVANNNV